MPKRRAAGRAHDDDDASDVSSQSLPGAKRPKRNVVLELYEMVRQHRNEEGRLVCEHFIRLPKRRAMPEYFEITSQPIDMTTIGSKVRSDSYTGVEHFSLDMDILVKNAKAFYEEDTQEYKDACDLWEIFTAAKRRLLNSDVISFGSNNGNHDDPKQSKKIILNFSKLTKRAAAAAGNGGDDAEEDEEMDDDDAPSEASSFSNMTEDPLAVDPSASVSISNVSREVLNQQLEEVFGVVMTAVDGEGRELYHPFQLLVSKKEYPSYYKVIKNPIDLKMIAEKIQTDQYSSLNDIEKDFNLLFKNATTFNEPSSLIYKDAKTLRRLMHAKKTELERGITPVVSGTKSSERIRSKRATKSYSAAVAAMEYEDSDHEVEDEDEEEEEVEDEDEEEEGAEPSQEESEEDEEEEEEEEEQVVEKPRRGRPPKNDPKPPAKKPTPMRKSVRTAAEEEDEDNNDDDLESEDLESPMWELYEAVANFTNKDGYHLSQPFIRLPSKRHFPDYYEEIQQPVSMNMIKGRIRKNQYDTLSDLADEFNLMFDNAKQYNRADSRIYRDAVKLQKLMQAKCQELLELESSDDEAEEEEESKKKEVRFRAKSGGSRMSSMLKKRLKILYRTVLNHKDDMGRKVIDIFMEKPCKRTYPDYYKIIAEPIDMVTIEQHIKDEKYTSVDEIVADFKLMFNNCREYNEEGSLIYEDANKLEAALLAKVEEFKAELTPKQKLMKRLDGAKKELTEKLMSLFDAIKDFKDSKGRQLSVIFNKLPNQKDFRDYFEVIKNPICLDKIHQKIKQQLYNNLDELMSDIILMFDNACKYNEPDSQIYKDALVLQKVALQRKIQLQDDDGMPDVQLAVQELLLSLFTSLYNHTDSEGRCLSDSLQELPEYEDSNGVKYKAPNLDMVKQLLDKGHYRRLDHFQEDVFTVLTRARNLSRSDSQVFEDAYELQAKFIELRNEACQNGDLLWSPALQFTRTDLFNATELLRAEKSVRENQQQQDVSEDEARQKQEQDKIDSLSSACESVIVAGFQYKLGDYVYIVPREKGMEPHIIQIEKFYRDDNGGQMVWGTWYYRPNETYHLPTRKFIEKELFRSDNRSSAPAEEILGKCYVMYVKDYFRNKPVGFEDEDIYVCESRYSTKMKSFKKLAKWRDPRLNLPDNAEIVARDEPLECKRVLSMFKDQEFGKSSATTTPSTPAAVAVDRDVEHSFPAKLKPDVEISRTTDGKAMFEQYTIPASTIKLGDAVYVRAENGKKLIARVESMWVEQEIAYFHGPWFVTPPEIPNPSSSMFYNQEVFLSSIEDTNPLLAIIGKCSVLEMGEYPHRRPTEIPEKDVYVCESFYEESKRIMKPLDAEKGLRKFELSPYSTPDETYFLRKPVVPQKIDWSAELTNYHQAIPAGNPHPFPQHQHQFQPQQMPPPAQLIKPPGIDQFMDDSSASFDSVLGSPAMASSVASPAMPGNPHPVGMQPTLGAAMTLLNPSGNMVPPPIPSPAALSPLSMTPMSVAKINNGGSGPATPGTPGGSASNDGRPGTPSGPEKSTKKAQKKALPYKVMTGYTLFSSEVRKSVITNNPNCHFGEISRLVGGDWRALPDTTKKEYEERAQKMNEEAAAKAAKEAPPTPQQPEPVYDTKEPDSSSDGFTVWVCGWDGCKHVYEEAGDLIEHVLSEEGHVNGAYRDASGGGFNCMWRNCPRAKKGVGAFPKMDRLIRHVKEVHAGKHASKRLSPQQLINNSYYFPSKTKPKPLPVPVEQKMQQEMTHLPPNPFPYAQLQHPQQQFQVQQQAMQQAPPPPAISMHQHQQQMPQLVSQGQFGGPRAPYMTTTVTVSSIGGHTTNGGMVIKQQGPAGQMHGIYSPPPSTPSPGPQGQQSMGMGPPGSQQQQQGGGLVQQQQAAPQQQQIQKPLEPIFVPAPKVSRLIHSEIYLRYIENLKPDRPTITDFDRTLKATRTNTVPQGTAPPPGAAPDSLPANTLPYHWLSNSEPRGPVARRHGNLTGALWALRKHMVKDALRFKKVLFPALENGSGLSVD